MKKKSKIFSLMEQDIQSGAWELETKTAVSAGGWECGNYDRDKVDACCAGKSNTDPVECAGSGWCSCFQHDSGTWDAD